MFSTKQMIGHHSRLRDVMVQVIFTPFLPVLSQLITRVINESTLHFAVALARNIIYLSNT